MRLLFLIVAASLAAVTTAISASVAPPFWSASGVCVPPSSGDPNTDIGGSRFSSGDLPGHSAYLARVTAPEDPGALRLVLGETMDPTGAGIAWTYGLASISGVAIEGQVTCAAGAGAIPWRVDLLDVPAAPTSFSGEQRYFNTSAQPIDPSLVAFRAESGADYVADLQVSQGAVTLGRFADAQAAASRSTPENQREFASSGTYSFGYLARGGTGLLTLLPHDGPAAHWQINIRQLSVELTNLASSVRYVRPGMVVRLSYHTSGDTSIDSTIVDRAGHTIRQLATGLGVGRGTHSLSWDGLTSSGARAADGVYTFAVHSTDPTGSAKSLTLPLTVDTKPPTAKLLGGGVVPADHGIVTLVSDAGSGVATAYLNIDGRRVASLQRSQTRIVYLPPAGWTSGRHTFEVIAIDRAGNRGSTRGTFTVRGPSALPITARATTVRPRHSCPRSVIHETVPEGTISLAASAHSPDCVGAGLMAEDIYVLAVKQFPRLPKKYVAVAHGTDRAGDRSALFPCTLHSKFVINQHSQYRQTAVICVNYRGDNFQYVFLMA